MLLFALFITACGHFFTEYTLQKTKLGLFKRKSIWGLFMHALLWTAAICPGLFLVDIFAPWKVYFLFFTHTAIDFVKMRLKTGKIKATHPLNIADQLLHLLTVAITYLK